MTDTQFRKRIRLSLADESLQAALDANAERRLRGRESAFASLGDWRERRRRAHAVRAKVIAHLDKYLADFTAMATQNGIAVHRARDAAQAISLVLEIVGAASRSVRRRPQAAEAASSDPPASRLFAKSKSMVSEEIELNRALEARGHRVVETDLGEYIVQLRGEKPAHIITPAVHLRRHQVGELFHEQLGLPYTEDIPTLTAAARRVLREVFLEAEIGVSGVNFGVAETGTLCIVTNEGNGRMVTTVPPVHIALMGMERLVPTLDDLALMLSLLARSATGQKLSAYTQLIQRPRGVDEIDGASERHVIIVDNGRSQIRNSRLQEALYCIRCGACLNACPVFREIGGHTYVGADGSIAPYPGPIGSVVSPGLLGLPRFGHLAQASSLCGACKDVCPVDIDLPRLLTNVRAGQGNQPRSAEGVGLALLSRVGLRAYNAIGSSPRLFELSQRLGGIAARIISPFSEWMWLPAWTGWGYSKDLPRPALKPFRARFRPKDSPLETGTRGATPPLTSSPTTTEPSHNGRGPGNPGSAIDTGSPEIEPVDLVLRFVQELEALGAQAYRTKESELPALLLGILRERSIDSVLAWDTIEPVDLTRLCDVGIRLVRSVDPTIRAGITGATFAVAQTGTLVLTSGAGQPLTASLMPEIHIAVIRSRQIVWSLEEALQASKIPQASAAVLVTGPSRTADIEMTLTLGVHGPRELHVCIVDEHA
jgi:L-lactate dehydrogenase complex protein LldF